MKCPACGEDFLPEPAEQCTAVNCPHCGALVELDRRIHAMRCPDCQIRMSIENWMQGSPVICPGCGHTVTPVADGDEPTLQPGQQLGQYRIVRCLGAGGVAEVYQATHTLLGIDYALKLLKPAIAESSPLFNAQLLREARLACRLQHPNLISVIDANCDSDAGYSYIVMDFIDGYSAEEMVSGGPLPESQVLDIARGVAQALLEAQKYHLVHRDIKPANIMIDKQGNVKLADLGLAIHQGNATGEGDLILGTPNYASPEQLRCSQDADARSDFYSLGATMYHLLTGVRPFGDGEPLEIIDRVQNGNLLSPGAVNPQISPATSQLVAHLMARNPEERPATAEELLQLLSNHVVTEQPAVKLTVDAPQSRRKIPFIGLAVGVVLLAAIGLIAGWFYTHQSTPGVPGVQPKKALSSSKVVAKSSTSLQTKSSTPVQTAKVSTPKPAQTSARPAVSRRSARRATSASKPAVQPQTRPAVSKVQPVKRQVAPRRPFPKPLATKPPKLVRQLHSPRIHDNRGQRLAQVLHRQGKLKVADKSTKPQYLYYAKQIATLKQTPPVRNFKRRLTGNRHWEDKIGQWAEQLLQVPVGSRFNARELEMGRKIINLVSRHAVSPQLKISCPGTKQKRPLLFYAAEGMLPYSRELYSALVKNGADPNLLPWSCRLAPEAVKYLPNPDIKIGRSGTLLLANLELTGNDFFNTRLYANSREHHWHPDTLATVEELLLQGCDVRARRADGVTALHLAASYGLFHLCEKLIWCGAEVNARDRRQGTPLNYAMRNGNRKIVKLLKKYGANSPVSKKDVIQGNFTRALLRGRLLLVIHELKAQADPYELTPFNANALQTAAVFDDRPMLNTLLLRKVDPTKLSRSPGAIQTSLLELAMMRDNLELFKQLLKNPAATRTKIAGKPILEYLIYMLDRSHQTMVRPNPYPYIVSLIEAKASLSSKGRNKFDLATKLFDCAIRIGINSQELDKLIKVMPRPMPGEFCTEFERKLRNNDYQDATIKRLQALKSVTPPVSKKTAPAKKPAATKPPKESKKSPPNDDNPVPGPMVL